MHKSSINHKANKFGERKERASWEKNDLSFFEDGMPTCEEVWVKDFFDERISNVYVHFSE